MGKYQRDVFYKGVIKDHIESSNPEISHYGRDHAPNRRYLPSDLSIILMHTDFELQNPQYSCSYHTYRDVLNSSNISFVKLVASDVCQNNLIHTKRYEDSRTFYETSKSIEWNQE